MIYDKPEHFHYNGHTIPVEMWAPITDEMVPGVREEYWISSLGNLYNSRTHRYSRATVHDDDYVRVLLYHKDGSKHMTTIHRLVCMAFNGIPSESGLEVDHINSIKSCSYYKNLEWVTKQENNRRACENNLLHVAEDNYHSIFTNDQVRQICEMLRDGTPINTIVSIAESMIYPNTSNSIKDIIYQILKRRTWTSVSKDYEFHDYSRIHFTDEEIHIICKCLEDGYRYDYILDEVLHKVCDNHERERLKETLYNIKRGRAFRDISCNYDLPYKYKKYK